MTAATLAPGTPSTTTRVGWIDGARGLSIALMIVSHVGLVTGLTPLWFHTVAMRPVAPVFVLLFAMLWRPGWRRRHWQLAAAAPIAQAVAAPLGFATPNILVVILLAVAAMPLVARWPALLAALAVTQLVFWSIDWWTGYAPGFVVVLLIVGHHVPPDGFVRTWGQMGCWLNLQAVGRRPLTWYLGHLLVLGVLVIASQIT